MYAGRFATELVQRADQLMAAVTNEDAPTVRALALRVHNGKLIELFGWESAARSEAAAERHPYGAAVQPPSRFPWNPLVNIKSGSTLA